MILTCTPRIWGVHLVMSLSQCSVYEEYLTGQTPYIFHVSMMVLEKKSGNYQSHRKRPLIALQNAMVTSPITVWTFQSVPKWWTDRSTQPSNWAEVPLQILVMVGNGGAEMVNAYLQLFYSVLLALYCGGPCGCWTSGQDSLSDWLSCVFPLLVVALWPPFVTVFPLKQMTSLALTQAIALNIPAALYEYAFFRPLIVALERLIYVLNCKFPNTDKIDCILLSKPQSGSERYFRLWKSQLLSQ